MAKYDKIIEDSQLDINSINLDFRGLKSLRDKVAHTGKIDVNSQKAYELLQPGVFGLQLVLLKRLGYNDLVYGSKDNFRTTEKFETYFKT